MDIPVSIPVTNPSLQSIEGQVLSALEAEDMLPESEQGKTLAVRELTEAVDDYRRHLDPEVATQRKELKALANAISDALDKFENLSPQSLRLYCNAANAPKGAVTTPLCEALIAAQIALTDAITLPNKTPNSTLNVLAYQVARVMRDILGIQPASTRDITEFYVGSLGGGAYTRLLRQVIAIAGESPPKDLYPLVSRALDLIKNPRGDFAD